MTATMPNMTGLTRTQDEQRAHTRARIEDLEFLLTVREYPERALERVGWTMHNAERSLYRHGRHDLVAKLRGTA